MSKTHDHHEFGRWLARLRAQAGLSQPGLAKAMAARMGKPFAHSTLAHWELGSNLRNAEVIPALASALGITIEELLRVQHTAKGYVPRTGDDLPPKRF